MPRSRDLLDTPPGLERAAWLTGPVLLAASLTGIFLIRNGPDRLFGISFGVLVGLVILWVMISALFPARPDRSCPECRRETLERLDPGSTRGIACSACGYSNLEESSFFMAEEEDEPMEPMILKNRSPHEPPMSSPMSSMSPGGSPPVMDDLHG